MNDYSSVSTAHRICIFFYGMASLGLLIDLFSSPIHRTAGQWVFLGMLLALLIGGHTALAIGASNARPWARAWSIVIAALYVFAFPLGTFVAVYLFYKCKNPWQGPKHRPSLAYAWPISPERP